jgi:hypothetical protein
MVSSVTMLLLTTVAKCQLKHRSHQLALAPIALQKPVSSTKVTVATQPTLSVRRAKDRTICSADSSGALYGFSSAFGVCAAGLSAFR